MTKTISQLSNECKTCSHVNICNNKRMVMCAMEELKPINVAKSMTILPLQSEIINIPNMNVYNHPDISLEKISEDLKRNFYNNLNCSFDK